MAVLTLSWGNTAVAQTKPFEDICAIVAQVTNDTAANCTRVGSPDLSYEYNFGRNSDGAALALESIVKKIGNPDSVRGNNHVWRVVNPDKNLQQKKTITIVFTHLSKGESKIMMDRVRPGSVYATGKKIKKRNKKKTINKEQKHPLEHLRRKEISR